MGEGNAREDIGRVLHCGAMGHAWICTAGWNRLKCATADDGVWKTAARDRTVQWWGTPHNEGRAHVTQYNTMPYGLNGRRDMRH